MCYTRRMNKPLISVVIPTYNRAALMKRAVGSVLSQSGEDFCLECIVVDDGSDDNTADVAAAIGDERLSYERLSINSGACAARNRGIHLARGEYIAFLDSDDVWHTDYVARQWHYLTESASDVVICRMEVKDEDGGNVHLFPNDSVAAGSQTYAGLLRYNAASTQVLFGRAECFKTVLFDETMPRMQDWDEVLRLAQSYKISYHSAVLVDTYVQSDSITRHPERAVAAMDKIFAKHKEAIEADKTAAVNFFRKKASFMKQAAMNPAEAYRMAFLHGGGLKDWARAIAAGALRHP